ncbi:uncharacterized protein LOC117299587 [Asterias rubens]|uniref:uncharacterized protein LOC117299587 n=1 Tax=Asterias rubens TaxID=7604 RepID=UPI0014554023|nr:uncharacterized protein LOC117299587 [Asterias rubens]
MANYGQPRVMLWVVWRSCSTAVLRSISQADGGVYYYEPFLSAAYEGPDSVFPRGEQDEETVDLPGADLAYSPSDNTFSWVKDTLEGQHEGARFVIVKDTPLSLKLAGRDWDTIPQGYQHTFLIRNPSKTYPSLQRANEEYKPPGLMDETAVKDWQDEQFETMGGDFKSISDLYDYVTDNNLDPNPFIMDADDLIAYPDIVLKAYCRATGIPFSMKMVEWEDSGQPPNVKWTTCQSHLQYFQCLHHSNAMKSRGFTKNIQAKPSTALHPKVAEIIQREMPFYNKMYGQRFVP